MYLRTIVFPKIIIVNQIFIEIISITMKIIKKKVQIAHVLTNRIEVVVAIGPGQVAGEGGERIEECPGGDDHVIDGDQGDNDNGAVSETLEKRRHAGKRGRGPEACVLAQHELEEEYR